MPLRFQGSDSKATVPTIVDAFGNPLTFTIEAKFKFVEDGNGAFRRLVWWGNESPLAAKGFCLGISPEGYLQIEVLQPAASPLVPGVIGMTPATSDIREAAVHGDYAFVTSSFGLTVIDVSNETAMALAGTLNVLMTSYHLALSADGTKLAVTGVREYFDAGALTNAYCFYLVDVSVPKSPQLLGKLETADFNFQGVAISGTRAYVACGSSGLKIINITNPSAPVVESTYPAANAKSVMVAGNYAYVSNSGDGFFILDISNPASPTFAGEYNTPGDAVSVFVSGTMAYVADGNSVQIIDVSNPTAPIFKGTFPSRANQVLVANNVASAATLANGLDLWDVTNPASPVKIHTLAPTGYPNPTTLGLCFDPGDSSIVYCANSMAGLALARTSPLPPTNVSVIADSFSAKGLAIRDDLIFVSGTRVLNNEHTYGLRILRDPADPRIVGEYINSAFDTGPCALSANGQYLFVTSPSAGLKVFDVSNLEAPVPVRTLALGGFAGPLTINGNYLYVGIGAAGLKVIDISDPLAPAVVGTGYDYPGDTQTSPKRTTIIGTTAYVAANNRLLVLNISNPLSPTLLGEYTSTFILDVVVLNNVAYVVSSGVGLIILDVTNPADIVSISTVPPPQNGTTTNVAVSGTRACVSHAGWGYAFSILDITNPSVPIETTRLRFNPGSVIISGDYAIAATGAIYLGPAP